MKITRDFVIAIALVVVVHAAGIAIGVALSRTVFVPERPPPPMPPIERITSELRLDDAQERAVRATLDTLRAQIDTLRKEIDPEIERALDDATEEIRAVLRDDQRTQFDRWRAERRPPHGPPPHGPPPHGPPPHGPPPHGPPPP